MQRLEVSGAVRPIYVTLGVKRLKCEAFIERCRLHQLRDVQKLRTKQIAYIVVYTFYLNRWLGEKINCHMFK